MIVRTWSTDSIVWFVVGEVVVGEVVVGGSVEGEDLQPKKKSSWTMMMRRMVMIRGNATRMGRCI